MPDLVNKYFDILYSSIRFPIQVLNVKGQIIYINSSFTRQWGYEIDELKEYSVFEDTDLR
jgi:PAS domain-containing protein